jgi:amidohydrolase
MIPAEKIRSLAAGYFPRILEIRRHLHMFPELSFEEYKTSEFIQFQLREAGIPFVSGLVKTGILATIEGRDPASRTILLRADMDALPINELNNVSYRSRHQGKMHACGHDAHSACVFGAALILNETKNEWKGTVRIIFQPGEEVLPGGAKLMINEGVLKNPDVQNAIALHVFPSMEAGRVGFRKGMYMASTDELYITVKGKGGHAAMTGEYLNPLIVASHILLAVEDRFMKKDASAEFAGEKIPTVIAFGKIEGKGATNVIPDTVELAGTFRTMNEQWREKVHHDLNTLVERVASDLGAVATLRIEKGYPFLVNDENFTSSCMSAAGTYLGAEMVEELPLRMTAEDFAFISQQVPSCFFRLGTGNAASGITSGVHTPTFDIDEKALETGAGLLAWLALNALRSL